jgi:predicted amidohydrolase YtcJ
MAGLTTVDDAGLGKDSIEFMHRMQKAGKLKLRIYAMASGNSPTLSYYLTNGPVKDDRMNVRSVKVYADGALGSRGACLLKPYEDQPGHYGFLLNPIDSMMQIARRAWTKGFQVCTHAIGDSASRVVLSLYGEVLEGKNDKRWRIEHCQLTDPADFHLYTLYDIIPSVQPTHATSDMYWAESRVGKKRLASAYAYAQLLKSAQTIALGTDFPVEKIDPLLTFYAAVCRKDLNGNPEGGFQMNDRLSRENTLRGMTIGAAFANFEEHEKGSIEPGKFADLVILNQDIMTVVDTLLPQTRVDRTILNGEMVYSRQ